jgi:hypothetical protein
MEDIIDAFQLLDAAEVKVDIVTSNVKRIPLYSPEEMDLSSILDRVLKLENKMVNVENSAAMNCTENNIINENIDSLKISLKPCADAQVFVSKKPSFAEVASNGKQVQEKKKRKKIGKSHTEVIQEQTKAFDVYAKTTEKTSEVDKLDNNKDNIFLKNPHVDNDGFITVKSRNKMKPKTIIGTNASTERKRFGAPLPSRYIVIERVLSDITENEIKQHLIDMKIDVRRVSLLSHPDSTYKKFVIEIAKSDIDKVYNENLWPKGVYVRKFVGFYSPKDFEKEKQLIEVSSTETNNNQNE